MSSPLAALSDADLWLLCTRGREDAWTALVHRYRRLVYTIPRRAGLDGDACADVFQCCFQRLLEHMHRVQDPSRIRAWLVTTAKRESLRQLERARVRQEVPGPPGAADGYQGDLLERVPDPSPLPDQLLLALEQQQRLKTAVQRLDDRTRRFVDLVFLQDEPLPYGEIASRLGIAEGSIGPTRARVLNKLRLLMSDDAHSPASAPRTGSTCIKP